MQDFDFEAPTTLADAVRILSENNGKARILAGGTDILVQLREGLRQARVVVDVKRIPELTKLTWSPQSGLSIGAAVPCSRVYEDESVCQHYPALADAARIVGAWQIQNRATLGGNLGTSSPAADTVPAMVVCQGMCRIASPSGVRTVPAAEFCTGPGKNVLAAGELIVSIEFPPPASPGGSAYLRFIPRNEMDIAVVGAGAAVTLDPKTSTIQSAKIALGAVAPTVIVPREAVEFLTGKLADEKTCEQAGELARKVAKPISDQRAPADYRMHLVGVLTKRALLLAARRAVDGPGTPNPWLAASH